MNMLKKEGLIKDGYELILKEIQLIITITYLVMIGIGMLFNFQKFRLYGINIFEYGDVFDFLIAPFQDRFIILTSAFAVLFPMFFLVLDLLWARKHPKSYAYMSFGWSRKPWYNTFRTISFFSLFLYCLWEVSLGYGRATYRNLELKRQVSVVFTDHSEIKGYPIGKLQEWIFIMDDDHAIHAIPTSTNVRCIIPLGLHPRPKQEAPQFDSTSLESQIGHQQVKEK